jgi:hypothetical protein
MPPNGLYKYRKEFNDAMRTSISACALKTGKHDVTTIVEYIVKQYAALIKPLIDHFVAAHIGELVRSELRRCTVSLDVAQQEALQEALQLRLAFYDMDEFRAVDRAIFVLDENNKRERVDYHRSTEAQRNSSITIKSVQIDADQAKLDRDRAANAWLHVLVEKYGDLAAEELVRLWLLEKQSARVN